MRKIFFFALILLYSGFLSAQINSFDLSSYKMPDIKRHVLDFKLDLDGSSYTNDEYYRNRDDNYRQSNNLSGNFNLNYSFYRNSEKIQSNQIYSINFMPSFRDYKDEDGLSSESLDLSARLYINSVNRFYYNSKKFIETNVEFNWNRGKSEDIFNSELRSSNSKNISLSIPIGFGFGRIEEIQDARLAIYILDELKEQGLLKRIPNEEEILEFAQLISELKSERFFDSRKKKIYEIEKVDAFLQSKDLIKNSNSKYYTVVYDKWEYAALPYRKTGQRISFGIRPELTNYNSESEYDDRINVNKYSRDEREHSLGVYLDYSTEKPINLYWQRSFNFYLSGRYLNGIEELNSSSSVVDIESTQLQSNVFYSIGYYPNTRTDMKLSFGIYFRNYIGEEDVNGSNNSFTYLDISPISRLDLNYYISPQFMLNLRYYINYSYNESNSEYYSYMYDDFAVTKNVNQNINISFIYQIL